MQLRPLWNTTPILTMVSIALVCKHIWIWLIRSTIHLSSSGKIKFSALFIFAGWRHRTYSHPEKINIAETLIFAELLRYIIHVLNIFKYLLYIQMQSIPLWELLRCIVVRINHIQISFLHTNAIKTIVRISVVSLRSKNE